MVASGRAFVDAVAHFSNCIQDAHELELSVLRNQIDALEQELQAKCAFEKACGQIAMKTKCAEGAVFIRPLKPDGLVSEGSAASEAHHVSRESTAALPPPPYEDRIHVVQTRQLSGGKRIYQVGETDLYASNGVDAMEALHQRPCMPSITNIEEREEEEVEAEVESEQDVSGSIAPQRLQPLDHMPSERSADKKTYSACSRDGRERGVASQGQTAKGLQLSAGKKVSLRSRATALVRSRAVSNSRTMDRESSSQQPRESDMGEDQAPSEQEQGHESTYESAAEEDGGKARHRRTRVTDTTEVTEFYKSWQSKTRTRSLAKGHAESTRTRTLRPGKTNSMLAPAIDLYNMGGPDEDLDKELYDVTVYYTPGGVLTKIATSELFSHITLMFIVLNTVYIGVEVDRNEAKQSAGTHIGFRLADNVFCTFFSTEWAIRFFAFKKKRHCLLDFWFKFDSALLALMVSETWIVGFFFSQSSFPLGDGGLIKMLRLLRLLRLGRLMRALPELLAMFKGVKVASRAVASALMMLVLLIYLFAIVMFTLLENKTDRDMARWENLFLCMWTLFVDVTLIDNIGIVSRDFFAIGAYDCFFVLVVFLLLAHMTVMNMLIGVLCEVVSAVAMSEHESAAIRKVKDTVLVMLKKLDEDGSGEISADEIQKVFSDVGALRTLVDLKVDIVHLMEELTMLFEEYEALSIHQIMDLILVLRGDRKLTMRDLQHQNKVTTWKINGSIAMLRCNVAGWLDVDEEIQEPPKSLFGDTQTVLYESYSPMYCEDS